jgi:transcriptional regulator with XRE-family HTH domain
MSKYHKFAEKLRDERKSRGFSKNKWAESLGVSDTAVAKWESGKAVPNARIVAALWLIHNIKPNDLLRFLW